MTPKVQWTNDCPRHCEKCLDLEFANGEKDIACLSKKHVENECLYEGNFIKKATKKGQVIVSSSQCLKNGVMDDIQVIILDIDKSGTAA